MKKCKKCGKEFAKQKYLDQHRARKTPCDKPFQCNKCYKIFDSNHKLKRHMKRKTPCAPEEVPVIQADNPDNRCQFCNNTYSTKSSLTRHQKTCDKDNNMKVMMQLVLEQNKQMAQQNQQLIKTVEQQSIDMKEMKQQLGMPSTTINNDNRQLNIQFVNFPIKDMSQIDMKQVLQIVANSETGQIIPAIVEHLHGNPNYPENQNIYMEELESDVTIVFGGAQEKTWHSIPRQDAFDQLKDEAMGILTHRNQPMPNYRLIEAAQELSHKDTSYHDKIADLSTDVMDDNVLAIKLVKFGKDFHNK